MKNINLFLQLLIIGISLILKYSIKNFFTENCKYSNKLVKSLVTQPFIDISLEAYSDTRNIDFDDLIKEYIFINLNTISNLPEYYSEYDSNVNFYNKK